MTGTTHAVPAVAERTHISTTVSQHELRGITVSHVSHNFIGGSGPVLALDDVTLSVNDGEFVAVLGPSGCGKSTLLRLVAGLIRPTSGEIRIHGGLVEKPRTDVGIAFQKPVLLPWRTVLGNVLLQVEMRGIPVSSVRSRALELLESVGLGGFTEHMPRELSGGMSQRVSIVRALVHDPPLLLMDEPFGALDALTREQMRVDLEQLWLNARKTVLFITHSIDEAILLADRVIVLTARPGRVGRIVEVTLQRPRGLDGRETSEYRSYLREITSLFLTEGVLRAR